MADEPSDLSYLVLRRCVGGLGIALPVALIVAGMFANRIEPSMSGFYYTNMRDVFVASNCVVGAFLLAYGGYEKEPDEWFSDRSLGVFTGLGAITLALIPTAPLINATSSDIGWGYVHLIAAACFLLGLGVFSFFKFSRTDGPEKNTYKALGLVIFGALAVILVCMFVLPEPTDPANPPDWLFWLEVVAVWAFGISWLIKGKTMEGLANLQQKLLGDSSENQ